MTTQLAERDHILGSPDSMVTLLEYGDYQCPFCGRAHVEIKRLLQDVGDKIQFSFRNFPLSEIHPQAKAAALAAEAAGLQDRFWPMHDLILENQRDLTSRNLLALADVVGLDLERFRLDVESPELAARVQEDFMSGVRSGVNGTPTFFVNGRRHDGPADYESLMLAIGRGV